MGYCLPVRPSDESAAAAAVIRVRALVLVEVRPPADALVVARRPSPVAVAAPADDLSGAGTPLGPLAGVVSLSGWR